MPLLEKFRFIFYPPSDHDEDFYRLIEATLHDIFDESTQCDCLVTTDPNSGDDEVAYFLTAYEEQIDKLIKTVESACHNLSSEPIFRGVEVYRRCLDRDIFRWEWYYEDLEWFDQPWVFGVVE